MATRAKRISDTMFMAAARALADMSPAKKDPSANLLPPVTALREVATAVAIAVAKQAQTEGLTNVPVVRIEETVRDRMWSPQYLPYKRAAG